MCLLKGQAVPILEDDPLIEGYGFKYFRKDLRGVRRVPQYGGYYDKTEQNVEPYIIGKWYKAKDDPGYYNPRHLRGFRKKRLNRSRVQVGSSYYDKYKIGFHIWTLRAVKSAKATVGVLNPVTIVKYKQAHTKHFDDLIVVADYMRILRRNEQYKAQEELGLVLPI